MDLKSTICILTSGRLFEAPFGEEAFTLSLGQWLIKQQLRVIVMGSGFASAKVERLSTNETENNITEQKKNIRTLFPPYPIYLLSRLFLSLLWFIKILSISSKTPIKLIHAQDTGYSGLAAIISGKMLRIPVVISSHGIRHKTIQSSLNSKFKRILFKFEYDLDIFTIKKADCVIAVSPSIKYYYEKLTKRKIEYVPIPINLQKFEFSEYNRRAIRKELGMDENTIVVGYVGRLSNEKNLLTLLASFANVAEENSSMKLVFVGTGPIEYELKDYAKKSGVADRVVFCGLRYDIDRILSSFDIFVLPSYTEGLSTALLEAMASGRPIICSDIPGNRELVQNEVEGLLINPYDAEDLKRAIQLLAADKTLQTKLSKNAKIKASQYDQEMVFPKILEYYARLAKKEPSLT